MNNQELLPHLFRTEFTKITAVLCRLFGIEHIAAAEDIASETFLCALETWPFKGIPTNPNAWLYTVAKNKARNYMGRQGVFSQKIATQLKHSSTGMQEMDIDLTDQNITDSQLQMLFTICNPCISTEAQIALALRILCGFGIDEIANAFLTGKETIYKRLLRAKEKLRMEKVVIEMPAPTEIHKRLSAVLTTLYLLFNEGWYSESHDATIREELCKEAIRLTRQLTENEQTNLPVVNALLALMCFHSSRLAARKSAAGGMVLYEDQDESLWNEDLIAKGAYFLHRASTGATLTKYHLEASIAYWHTIKADTPQKWEAILQLYNKLLQVEYSPMAALNRTFALWKTNGKDEAIKEAEKLTLTNNPYYFTLLGELYTGRDNNKAMGHFANAYALAKTNNDKQAIMLKMERIRNI